MVNLRKLSNFKPLSDKQTKREMNKSKNNVSYAFSMLVILFFMWGFLTSLNDILVPHLKAAFNLKHWQAQLVQFFFFGAYLIMSAPAGTLIKKIGYKKGIVMGLALMGLGCFLFYPASIMKVYFSFLLALFVLASGITILQVAANPYVAVVGPPETAASRLNLAQGFNSLGHTIAPLFGAFLILQNTEVVAVETVQMPYIGLGVALLVLAGIFSFLQLPEIENEKGLSSSNFSDVLKRPQVLLGVAAIFCYVGAEISVGSHLVEFFKLENIMGMDNKTAGSYVAFYWGGAMIGRFMGGVSLSKLGNKPIIMLAFPLIAFGVVYYIVQSNSLSSDIPFYFLLLMMLNYFAFLLGGSMPARVLGVFAFCCIALVLVAMFGAGKTAMWAVIGIGLFNSIMWSNIFTLAIEGLGELTSQASGLLVAGIFGGAIIPLVQGAAADQDLQLSFAVVIGCYLFIMFYALIGHKTT